MIPCLELHSVQSDLAMCICLDRRVYIMNLCICTCICLSRCIFCCRERLPCFLRSRISLSFRFLFLHAVVRQMDRYGMLARLCIQTPDEVHTSTYLQSYIHTVIHTVTHTVIQSSYIHAYIIHTYIHHTYYIHIYVHATRKATMCPSSQQRSSETRDSATLIDMYLYRHP